MQQPVKRKREYMPESLLGIARSDCRALRRRNLGARLQDGRYTEQGPAAHAVIYLHQAQHLAVDARAQVANGGGENATSFMHACCSR